MVDIAMKHQWPRIVKAVQPIDGFVMTAALCAIVGIGVANEIMVRLICVGIAAVAGVLFASSMHAKQTGLRQGFRDAKSPSYSPEEGSAMKKLVFDDFQPHMRVTAPPMAEEVAAANRDTETMIAERPFVSVSPMKPTQPLKVRGTVAPAEFQISDFFDVNSDVLRGPAADKGQPELRDEFDFLLNKVLHVVKEVTFSHTVAFFWANREKQHMVCEAKVTESQDFLSTRRFPVGHDIVSQIAGSGKPELITQVNPTSEQELICYYNNVQYIKSLVGVPVFYPALPSDQMPAEPVGVLILDSTTEDAFGYETIALLGQFTKLISALIKTSTDKYDLLLDAELLNSIRRLQERIRTDFSTPTIAQSLIDEGGKLLNWNFISVVLYDDVKRAWTVKKVVNRIQEAYVAQERIIDFGESIVGKSIKSNTHHVVHDLETEQLPRYHSGEKLVNYGSFVSIPISSLNKCYGAINVESRDKYNFSRRDIEILYRLADNAASALEILYMNDIIKEHVVTDDVTGAYSRKFFLKRMEEELARADDYGTELSVLLFAIDYANRIVERYGSEGMEAVLIDISRILRSSIRQYDCISRYDFNRFGAILVNTAANDAYLWAEKIRKTIASHIINIDDKGFSVTVSAGVCGALEGMKAGELFDHATAVLHKGMEGGGNTVRVF
jgi:diguanylate cyclase (GGDEF)-like protein